MRCANTGLWTLHGAHLVLPLEGRVPVDAPERHVEVRGSGALRCGRVGPNTSPISSDGEMLNKYLYSTCTSETSMRLRTADPRARSVFAKQDPVAGPCGGGQHSAGAAGRRRCRMEVCLLLDVAPSPRRSCHSLGEIASDFTMCLLSCEMRKTRGICDRGEARVSANGVPTSSCSPSWPR
jgi:hypothetical protein